MNCKEEDMEKFHYPELLGTWGKTMDLVYGYNEVQYCCNTYQFWCGNDKRGCEKIAFTPPVNGQLSTVNGQRKPAKLAVNNGNRYINRFRRGRQAPPPAKSAVDHVLCEAPGLRPYGLSFLFQNQFAKLISLTTNDER